MMSRRPAILTQTEIARIIRAAKEAGAVEVAIPTKDGHPVIVKLNQGVDAPLAPDPEIVLY